MEDNICKNCKYWEQPSKDQYVPDDTEDQEMEYYVTEAKFGKCVRGRSDSGIPRDETTKMFGSDSESYAATVRTTEDFGRVMFEKL